MNEYEVLQHASTNQLKFAYSKVAFKGKAISRLVTLPPNGLCHLHTANEEDLMNLYPLLFKAAKQGEGFGLDEIPNSEIFTTYFMKERVMLVINEATNGSKVTIAVVIIGPSRICRYLDPSSCSIYMLVMPGYRNKGIGTALAHLSFKYIQDSGYTSILTDILVTDNLPYSFMTRLGFSNVGCIPKSAYVAGKGYSDAILFYKKLNGTYSGKL